MVAGGLELELIPGELFTPLISAGEGIGGGMDGLEIAAGKGHNPGEIGFNIAIAIA